MEYRYIDRFFFFFFLRVTGLLYVSLFSGEVIVIRYQHIAGCQSLYSYILTRRRVGGRSPGVSMEQANECDVAQ